MNCLYNLPAQSSIDCIIGWSAVSRTSCCQVEQQHTIFDWSPVVHHGASVVYGHVIVETCGACVAAAYVVMLHAIWSVPSV